MGLLGGTAGRGSAGSLRPLSPKNECEGAAGAGGFRVKGQPRGSRG